LSPPFGEQSKSKHRLGALKFTEALVEESKGRFYVRIMVFLFWLRVYLFYGALLIKVANRDCVRGMLGRNKPT
jgi:hypothetical protein